MHRWQLLIDKINAQGLLHAPGPLPVVSLEDYFEGNEDAGSIGCNLLEYPGLQRFFDHLRSIRARADVQDVLIEIMEVQEDSSGTPWPFSERVYILSKGTAPEVAKWMVPLQPDEVEIGYFQGKPPAAPDLRDGMQVYAVWWD